MSYLFYCSGSGREFGGSRPDLDGISFLEFHTVASCLGCSSKGVEARKSSGRLDIQD
jgi:hypothetical protein